MTTEEIIEHAKTRQEPVWQWGQRIRNSKEVREFARNLDLFLKWGEPIRPGQMYLAQRNTGVKLLECKDLSDKAFVIPAENEYSFDFNECVLVEEYR